MTVLDASTSATVPGRGVPGPIDHSRQAAARVFEALRGEIVGLVLLPGAALPRAELQARFAVSSTPLRDALLRLRAEGLVDIFPQHATRVSLIDLDAARQAHFLRRSIEIEIASVLVEAPPPGLVERLRAIAEQQDWLAGRGEFDPFAALDLAFHELLYEAAGVTHLWHLVRRESGQIDRLRRLHLPVEGKAQQVVADHFAIAAAIEAGDGAAAQAAIREHLSKSIAFGPTIRARHPHYFR